jgi:hypothetical protein
MDLTIQNENIRNIGSEKKIERVRLFATPHTSVTP